MANQNNTDDGGQIINLQESIDRAIKTVLSNAISLMPDAEDGEIIEVVATGVKGQFEARAREICVEFLAKGRFFGG